MIWTQSEPFLTLFALLFLPQGRPQHYTPKQLGWHITCDIRYGRSINLEEHFNASPKNLKSSCECWIGQPRLTWVNIWQSPYHLISHKVWRVLLFIKTKCTLIQHLLWNTGCSPNCLISLMNHNCEFGFRETKPRETMPAEGWGTEYQTRLLHSLIWTWLTNKVSCVFYSQDYLHLEWHKSRQKYLEAR